MSFPSTPVCRNTRSALTFPASLPSRFPLPTRTGGQNAGVAASETVGKPSAICGYSRFIRVNSRFSSFLNANGRKYPQISTNPEWRNRFPDRLFSRFRLTLGGARSKNGISRINYTPQLISERGTKEWGQRNPIPLPFRHLAISSLHTPTTPHTDRDDPSSPFLNSRRVSQGGRRPGRNVQRRTSA